MGRKILQVLVAIVLLLLLVVVPAYFLLDSDKMPGAASGVAAMPEGIAADLSRLPVVYASDFATAVDAGWSASDHTESPSGRTFLGRFVNDTVSLRVHNLPPHELVRVSFELFIIDTWDGVGRISAAKGPCGPDFVEVDVDGGPNLLRATFATLPDISGFANDGKLQTYPSPIPSQPNPVGTGASVQNGLGYAFRFGGTEAAIPMDGTYPMSFTFPHTGGDLRLFFSGAGLQDLKDESWGIADVKVEVLAAKDLPAVDDATIERWFNTLCKAPAIPARAAFWNLVARGDQTVLFLQSRAGGFGVDWAQVAQWLAAAGTEPEFGPAMQNLITTGPAAEFAIRDAVITNASLAGIAAKARQEIALMPIDDPAARDVAAAARLLATINTPRALKLYVELAHKPAPVRSIAAPAAPFKPTKPLYGSIDQIAPNRWLVTGGDGAMVANDTGDELRFTYGHNRVLSLPERRLLDTRLATTQPAIAEALGLTADQLDRLKQVPVVDMVVTEDFTTSIKEMWLGYLEAWRSRDYTPQQKMRYEGDLVARLHEAADWSFWDTRKAQVQSVKQVQAILTADQVRHVMQAAPPATQPAVERP